MSNECQVCVDPLLSPIAHLDYKKSLKFLITFLIKPYVNKPQCKDNKNPVYNCINVYNSCINKLNI